MRANSVTAPPSNHDRPERVPGLSGITAIATGGETSYAIRADGSVLAWGDNSRGELGNGTKTGMSATPVPIPGLTGVTQISGNTYGTLAVAGSSGTVWGWGDNFHGNLGDGTLTSHYTPEQTGLTGVSQISVGSLVTAALLSNGTVLTWGENTLGDLGIGTIDASNHASPVLVRTIAGASQIVAGVDHVLAIASPAPRIPSVIGYTQSEAAQALAGRRLRARPRRRRRRPHLRVPRRGQDPEPRRGHPRPAWHGAST